MATYEKSWIFLELYSAALTGVAANPKNKALSTKDKAIHASLIAWHAATLFNEIKFEDK